MKTCTKCKVEKAFTEFYKKASSADGYNSSCKECFKILYYENNKEKRLAQAKAYHEANREKRIAQGKAWREANREKRAAQQKAYQKANKEKLKAWHEANKDKIAAYKRKKFKIDPKFKMAQTLRQRMRKAIKSQGIDKSESTMKLVGGSVAFVKKWIESKFLPGMTWENHGEWHIDHIKPCASFDLTDLEQQRKCFNYTNLQPLWAVDNLRKGDRF